MSKQMARKVTGIELVRTKRESGNQILGFASRPFVLCGLPIKRPRDGVLLHERRNGHFLLQVTGHPRYGFPWGQDRLMREARIWYSRDAAQQNLPGECRNTIVLSEELYQEIKSHPIPTDLAAAKAVSSSPAALDLFTWLSYRCFVATGEERIPAFGEFGLVSQLGSARYSRPRKFRERLVRWLELILTMWPDCPARLSADGGAVIINRAQAVVTKLDQLEA